jgi:hypothetical protein
MFTYRHDFFTFRVIMRKNTHLTMYSQLWLKKHIVGIRSKCQNKLLENWEIHKLKYHLVIFFSIWWIIFLKSTIYFYRFRLCNSLKGPEATSLDLNNLFLEITVLYMPLGDDKLGWGWIVIETLETLFLFLSKDYLYRNKTIFFLHFFHNPPPICHLPAAGAKWWFQENRVFRYKDIASLLWLAPSSIEWRCPLGSGPGSVSATHTVDYLT